ncbi:MAG: response regulator transcription factor [Anaerolineae bacterium]|nr:response regulator transcription factor [Anaerolineae bacterium]
MGDEDNGPTILVVEDDPVMSSLVTMGLRYEDYEVLSASDGLEGLRLYETERPDLVILDWMLPGMDGITLCRMIRAQSDVPIIMITAREAVEDRVEGLETGADDYVVKPFHMEELIARVHARMRRRHPQETTLSFEDLTLDPGTHEVFRGRHQMTLTTTEFKLLTYFLRNARQVLSKEQILEDVWGYDFLGDVNIVEQYVRSLRQKMGAPSLIQTIRGAGYALREASE